MGNVNMEAKQVHVRNNSHKTWHTIADAIAALDNQDTMVNNDIEELYTRDSSRASKDDIALDFSEDTRYYVGDIVYYEGTLWKCIHDHQAGAWNPVEFAVVKVSEVLISLESGLTNYQAQNDINLEVPTRKNLIPMTVDAIKAANTSGIWSGDSYTLNGVTMAIQKDTDGNVEGVKLTGNNTLGSSFYLYVCAFTCKAGQKYYMNGCPEGGGVSSYLLSISGSYPDTGSGSTINPFSTDTTISVRITIVNGYDFGSGGKIFKPMIRPATITDPTFAPYIPSVETRLDAVESGVDLTTSVNAGEHVTIDTTTAYIIKVGCIVVCMLPLTATQDLSANDEILLRNMPIPSKVRVIPITYGSKQFQCSITTSGVFKFTYSDNTLQSGETAKMSFIYPL